MPPPQHQLAHTPLIAVRPASLNLLMWQRMARLMACSTAPGRLAPAAVHHALMCTACGLAACHAHAAAWGASHVRSVAAPWEHHPLKSRFCAWDGPAMAQAECHCVLVGCHWRCSSLPAPQLGSQACAASTSCGHSCLSFFHPPLVRAGPCRCCSCHLYVLSLVRIPVCRMNPIGDSYATDPARVAPPFPCITTSAEPYPLLYVPYYTCYSHLAS